MSPSKVPMSVLAALGLVAVEGCGGSTPPAGPCLNIMVEPSGSDGETPTPADGNGTTPGADDDDSDEPDVGPCLEFVPDPEPDPDPDPDSEEPPPEPPEPPLGPCLSPMPPPAPPPVESPHEPEPGPCLRFAPEPMPSPDKPAPEPAPGDEEGDDPKGAVLDRGVLPSDVADLLRGRKGQVAPSRVPPSVLATLGLMSLDACCLPDPGSSEDSPQQETQAPIICLAPVPVEVGPCLSERPEPDVGPCLKPLMDVDNSNGGVPKSRPEDPKPDGDSDDEARHRPGPAAEPRRAVLERGVLPADVADVLERGEG